VDRALHFPPTRLAIAAAMLLLAPGCLSNSFDDDGWQDDDDDTYSECPDPSEMTLRVHSGDVFDDTWEAAVHLVDQSISVRGRIEVMPCAYIRVGLASTITVRDGGALKLLGEENTPITITSAATSPAPGDWDRIEIHETAEYEGTEFRHVEMEYGGAGVLGTVRVTNGASVAMTDCTVRDSGSHGVSAGDAAVLREFEGNTLVDNAAGPILLGPDHAGELGSGTYSPNTVEGIQLDGPTVTHDQTWRAHDAPYVVLNSFRVESASDTARLTIAAGSTVRMDPFTSITVAENGGLKLAGSADSQVVITSNEASPAPGDWSNLEFQEGSLATDNALANTVVEYGGGGLAGVVAVGDGASVAISSSTLRRSSHVGLFAQAGAELRNFEDNTLSDNAVGAAELGANEVDQLGPGSYGPNDTEGVLLRPGTVDHDSTWVDLGAPFVVTSDFQIQGGPSGSALLTLSAGVTVQIGQSGGIVVGQNGGLTLDGSPSTPVSIASAQETPGPGDWQEIELRSDSAPAGNVFRHAHISSGGGGPYGQVWVADGATLTLDDVTFTHAGQGCDIYGTGTLNASGSSYVLCD